ncbi:hypothetical protein GCM10018775_88900 [Streptomyces umbrinus]|nr:hypothetical protein GCM10018775_88900 [Streptomyces umbrinus]
MPGSRRPGDVGNLNLTDQAQGVGVANQFDEVSLADLGVVVVQVHPQAGPAHRLDQGVGGRVEVLQGVRVLQVRAPQVDVE